MPARSALVVGSGVAGLTIAFRLRRSAWDVVLLDHDVSPPQPDPLVVLHGDGHDAARRLGLAPALAELLCREDIATVVRTVLSGVTIRSGVRAVSLVPDDCGVTVTFSGGDDDWFDLVVCDGAVLSHVDGALGRIVVVGDGTPHDISLDLYAAELLGDAFDIFPDAETAVRWWQEQLRPPVREAQTICSRASTAALAPSSALISLPN